MPFSGECGETLKAIREPRVAKLFIHFPEPVGTRFREMVETRLSFLQRLFNVFARGGIHNCGLDAGSAVPKDIG